MGKTKLDVSAGAKDKKTSRPKKERSSKLKQKDGKKRKKSSDIKVETPKKAKKRKDRESKSKRKLEKLKSSKALVVEEAKTELIEAQIGGISNDEQEYMDQYRHMFTSLQGLMEAMEKRMGDNPQSKDVYALMNMYSQMRECINDMRLIKDTGQVAEQLASVVLEPLVKAFGEAMINLYFKTVAAIRESAPEDQVADLIDKLKYISAEQGASVQSSYEVARDRLYKELAPGGK